jgi:hypothetical protein
LPIRVLADIIRWFTTVVIPAYIEVVSALPIPFNIIFVIGTFLAILLIIFAFLVPDFFVWLLVGVWTLSKFFFDIYLAAVNEILQFLYNWYEPIWNELVAFFNLIFTMVWAGLCDGAEPFQQIVDCAGYDNFLSIIQILANTIYNYYFIMANLMLTLAIGLFNILGSLNDPLSPDYMYTSNRYHRAEWGDFEKTKTYEYFYRTEGTDQNSTMHHGPGGSDEFKGEEGRKGKNFCEMPACSDWGKVRVDPLTGNVKYYPGLLGLNLKSMLGEQDVRVAQFIAKILVAILQWLFEEVLGFLAVMVAFVGDVLKLFLFYFVEFVIWAVQAFSNLLGSLYYILTRGLENVLTQPSLEIVFDPDWWRINITDFKQFHNKNISDAFTVDYLNSTTELFLDDPSLPFPELRLELKKIYGIINIGLQMLFEAPLVVVLVIDKGLCVLFNLLPCIGSNLIIICNFFFKPPLTCVAWQKMATNDTLIANGWYYNYQGIEKIDVDLYAYCADFGCQNITTPPHGCPTSAPGFCQVGEQFNCKNLFGEEIPIDPNSFFCLDFTQGGFGPPLFGPPFNASEAICVGGVDNECIVTFEDGPTLVIPTSFLGGTDDFLLTEFGCNITSETLGNDTCRYCAAVFELELAGILFPSRYTWSIFELFNWVAVVDVLDALAEVLGESLWAGFRDIGYWFRDQCLDLAALLGQCPCNTCPTNPTQLLYYIDIILFNSFTPPGYPCNPTFPADGSCCQTSPWFSLWFLWEALLSAFDIFGFFT